MQAIARLVVALACLSCARTPASVASAEGSGTTAQTAGIAAGPTTGFSPGLIDTLVAIAGAPRKLEIRKLPPGTIGAYSMKHDVILIDPWTAQAMPRHTPDSTATWVTRISPDWVLAHEFGHRYDKRRGFMPSRSWIRASYAVPASSSYANTHVVERWAEAFANAIDFLRYASAEPGHAATLRSLAQREAFAPGTADVVQFLLRHRIYARHPLNLRRFRNW